MKRIVSLKIYIVVATLVASCGQSFNSNTTDYLLLPSNYCEDQSNTSLCEANEVLQTKCTSCHEGYHDTWAAYSTNAAWIESGLVVAGNPAGSDVVIRLKNYGTGLTNMPKDAPALSQDEYDKIEAWINSL